MRALAVVAAALVGLFLAPVVFYLFSEAVMAIFRTSPLDADGRNMLATLGAMSGFVGAFVAGFIAEDILPAKQNDNRS